MTCLRTVFSTFFVSVAVVALPSLSHAKESAEPAEQPVAIEGKRYFRADFFIAYAPVTALDMVQRIPGFSIAGDEGRRGFGENAGNVLIEGAGPVGLTLAIDLALPGVDVIVVETRKAGEPPEPKCNHVAARTMEIFRRLGLAEKVRNAGLPEDYPHDISYRFDRFTALMTTAQVEKNNA